MLIDGFHHPAFHDAARVGTVQVYPLPRFFVLEAYARAGSGSFIMLSVPEIA